MHHPRWIPALLLAAGLIGCGDSSSSGSGATAVAQTPDALFKAYGSAQDGQPQALWNALPDSYQSDVEGLISDFAGKMDPDVWEKGFATFGKLVDVLDKKRDYILGHPMVAGMTAMMGLDQETLGTQIDATVKAMAAISDSDLATVDGLKNLDVEEFLSSTIGANMKDLMDAAGSMDPAAMGGMGADPTALVGDITTKVLSEEGDSAVVEVTMADGEVQQMPMTKVDGHWLPKEMVDEWAEGIADARENLATFEISPEDKNEAMGAMAMVDGVLNQLLEAGSQEEFNQAVDGIMQMAEMMGG